MLILKVVALSAVGLALIAPFAFYAFGSPEIEVDPEGYDPHGPDPLDYD